jgi:hypothetical protein
MDPRQQRKANLRLGLITAALALASVGAFVYKIVFMGPQ